MSQAANRFLVWGTSDTGKPRVRMLLEALRAIDPVVPMCLRNPWEGIEDKSSLKGLGSKLGVLIRWLLAYPALVLAYLRAPAHTIVVVPYPGNLDVLLLWPFAKLRGAKICWDMFISLYDTVVEDRRLMNSGSLRARALYGAEWLSTRAAAKVLLDTDAHARYVAELYGLPAQDVGSFWVGVEEHLFTRAQAAPSVDPVKVLFYGQFIPLHGLDKIIEAARLVSEDKDMGPIQFTLVGTGQEAARIDSLVAESGHGAIERIEWVDYGDLPSLIAGSSICLGVFGDGGKAARVIPNKVFQILAVGRPLITMDGPAIREIVAPGKAVRLVPPGDALALANAIIALARELREPYGAEAIHRAAQTEMPVAGVETVRARFAAATELL